MIRGSSTSSSQDQQQQGHEQQAGLKKPQMISRKQTTTRRRAHTSRRPYQERLLNMAEARREIVTALRIHRAGMRQQQPNKKCQLYQQQEQRRQRPRLQQQPPVQVTTLFQEQSHAFEGVLPPTMAMSYVPSSKNHLCSSCSSPSLANLIAAGAAPAAGNDYSSSSMLSYHLTPLEEEEAPAAAAAVGGLDQQLLACCSLPPAQPPLGLNLSFHYGFGGSQLDNVKNGDDTPFGGDVPLIQPSSSCPAASSYRPPAYSSSPLTAAVAGHGYSSSAALSLQAQLVGGDGEMLYYSIGGSDGEERQQGVLELSETDANVAAASAWWTKILESGGDGGESAGAPRTTTIEAEPAGMAADYDDDVVVAAGLPEWHQWLCDGVEQEVPPAWHKPDIMETIMHADDGDHHSGCNEGDNNGGDIVVLPCMDDIIGDIEEGWADGEWFP